MTFVFHDQNKSISDEISRLDDIMHRQKSDVEYIHTGPIIRKEGIFEDYSLDERRSLIYKIC